MRRFLLIPVLLAGIASAQVASLDRHTSGDAAPAVPAAPAASDAEAAPAGESSSRDTKIEANPFLQSPDVRPLRSGFDWQAASNQSLFFLGIEHGVRMNQRKTRAELGGHFWEDYRNAVSGLGGWGDTDAWFTNYVGHTMQGAVSGFIQIQNDPRGMQLEFGDGAEYWRSRTKALGWAALYSTQFELGLISEASIGNVGKKRGTMGFVDLVMTPTAGLGLLVVEDMIDKKWIERMEETNPGRLGKRRFYRMVLNPQRTFANLLRLKKPWHRDTRSISWEPAPRVSLPARKPPVPVTSTD